MNILRGSGLEAAAEVARGQLREEEEEEERRGREKEKEKRREVRSSVEMKR